MRIAVDTNKCRGIGLCEMTAPTVFEVREDGKAHLLNDQPSAEEMRDVHDAITNCPTGALSIED